MIKLPTCKHCGVTWTYKDSLKNMLRYKCPYCGQKNYVRTFRARDIAMGILSPAIFLFLLPLFELSFSQRTIFLFVILVIYFVTFPINLQLSKEEEPFF